MIAADYVPTDFHLTYPARAAYVLVRRDNQSSGQLAEMAGSQDGSWDVTLRMKPGMYWYRFYVNDGSVTVLVPGWEGKIVGGASGWDAILRVPRRNPNALHAYPGAERASAMDVRASKAELAGTNAERQFA